MAESKPCRLSPLYNSLIFDLDWKAESDRQHEETIEAVKETAQEQVPFNIQGVSLERSCIDAGN